MQVHQVCITVERANLHVFCDSEYRNGTATTRRSVALGPTLQFLLAAEGGGVTPMIVASVGGKERGGICTSE